MSSIANVKVNANVQIDSNKISKAEPQNKISDKAVTLSSDKFNFDSNRFKTSIKEGIKFEAKVYSIIGASVGTLGGLVMGGATGAMTGNPKVALIGAASGLAIGAGVGAIAGATSGAIDGTVVGFTKTKTSAQISGALTAGTISTITALKTGKVTTPTALISTAVSGLLIGAYVGGKIFDKTEKALNK